MAYHHMNPPQMLDLQAEIRHHPDLVEDLKHIDDLGQWFARVATSAGVVVDGLYHIRDLPGLSEMLTRRLYESRTSLVILGGKKR